MRAHHEKIAIRLLQSVVNNPSNNILVFFTKNVQQANELFKGAEDSVVDLQKTKTKGFEDTFINKSSSVDIYS